MILVPGWVNDTLVPGWVVVNVRFSLTGCYT